MKAHNAEIKARAIAMLAAGEHIAEVARQLGLAESTIRTWGKRAGVDFAEIRAEKKENLADLVAACLAANLTALSAISAFVRDEAWLRRQRAGDVAMLYGVMSDKAVRILEAHAAAQPVEVRE